MLLLPRSLSAIFKSLPESVNHKFFIPWIQLQKMVSRHIENALWLLLIFRGTEFSSGIFKNVSHVLLGKKGGGGKEVFSFFYLKYISAHMSHSASDIGLLWSLDIGLNGAFLYSGSADLGNRTHQAQYSLWIKREMSSGRAGMGETEDSSELCHGVAEVGYSWCSWYFTE